MKKRVSAQGLSNLSWGKKILGLVVGISALLLAGCGGLNNQEAKSIILNSSPEFQKTIYVDTGFLSSRCGQPVGSGKYALLEKAGVISVRPGNRTEVLTTNRGDALFKQAGAQPVNMAQFKLVTGQQGCNVRSWAVPIADKQILDLNVTNTTRDSAEVSYNWKWKTNELGQVFTGDSDLYKTLNDKQKDSLLENELPLDNQSHATNLKLVRDQSGWRVAK